MGTEESLEWELITAYKKTHSEDEYIYVDSFDSTRWVIEGNKKITYYLGRKYE